MRTPLRSPTAKHENVYRSEFRRQSKMVWVLLSILILSNTALLYGLFSTQVRVFIGAEGPWMFIRDGESIRRTISERRHTKEALAILSADEYTFVQAFVFPDVNNVEIVDFDFNCLRHKQFLRSMNCARVKVKDCRGVSSEVLETILLGMPSGGRLEISHRTDIPEQQHLSNLAQELNVSLVVVKD